MLRSPRRVVLTLLALLALWNAAPAAAQMLGLHSEAARMGREEGGPVTTWTFAADLLGGGAVNWRTLAAMHVAMHDALNAARPRYARMLPAQPQEPRGADPELAMAAAAYQVLLARHPDHAGTVADGRFSRVQERTGAGPAADAAIRLGTAIGRATAERYRPSARPPQRFPAGLADGVWRPTPPFNRSALMTDAQPFLFARVQDGIGPPPPTPGSRDYVRAVAEVRQLGDDRGMRRTRDQTEAAEFWGRQTSQRGFLHLGAQMIAEHRLPGGMWDEARAMALLTMALADSYILSWESKRHWNYWRPVTAIQQGGLGVIPDADWHPLLPTPPHPEYPSGHAADCTAAAYLLQGLFGSRVTSVIYTAVDLPDRPSRIYDSLSAVAKECAESRLWAGAHFRVSNDEGARIGRLVAARALAALPPAGR